MGEELVPLRPSFSFVCAVCKEAFTSQGKLARHWKHIHCDPALLELSPPDREFLRSMRIACDA